MPRWRRDESFEFWNERESEAQQGTWVSEAFSRKLYVYVGVHHT